MPPTRKRATPPRKSAPRRAAPRATELAVALPEQTALPDEPLPPLPESAYPADAPPLPPAEVAAKKRCNVPGCPRDPETNGLCGGHYATHRGYANKEGRDQ